MKRLREAVGILMLILFLAVPWNLKAEHIQEDLNRDVLFISSYAYDWSSVPKQIDGISDVLDGEANVRYLFMDTKNVTQEMAEEYLRHYLEDIMQVTDFDVVILGDDAALDFALKYRTDFFGDIPLVFEGINSAEKAVKVAQDPLITGIAEAFPFEETISIAMELCPKAVQVVAITDNTVSGQGSLEQLLKYEDVFPQLEFKVMNSSELTNQEISAQTASYGEETILLFLMLGEDLSGHIYNNMEAMQLIRECASIPVFKADELGIGEGALGGCVISYSQMGAAAAQRALEILDGKDPALLPVVQIDSRYVFDIQVMKQFGIQREQLPEGMLYINDETGFWEENRNILIPVMVLLAMLLLVILVMVYDRRKRKVLNRELWEKKTDLIVAIEHSDMQFWIYNPNMRQVIYTDRNTGKEETTDNYPDSIFEQQMIHPFDSDVLRENFNRINAGEREVVFEVRMKHEGIYHWQKMHFTSVYDEEGAKRKVVCTSVNIDKQKEAERRYHNYMHAFSAESGNAIGTFRLNLSRNWCGDGFSNMINVMKLQESGTLDGFMDEICRHSASGEELEFFRENFSRKNLLEAFHCGNSERTADIRYYMEDNKAIWIRIFIHMAENPTTDEVEAVIYALDMDEQKVMEAVVNESVNHDYDFLLVVDGNIGTYMIYQSSKEESAFPSKAGVCCCEQIKTYINTYVVSEEKEQVLQEVSFPVILEALETDTEYVVYFTAVLPDGSTTRKKQRYSYIEKADCRLLLTQIDITDIYDKECRSREELLKALRQAEQANHAKTDFLARMSHDIRTPMNGIIGMTQLTLEEQIPDEVREPLIKIDAAAQFLLGLVNDILDMTKIESGNVELHPECYEGEDFLNYIRAVVLPLCQKKQIHLIYRPQEFIETIYVDKLRFNQIFFNLLSNAVKYTGDGGNVELSVTGRELAGDKTIYTYEVKDDGIGMSEAFQKQMFESFAQENNDISKQNNGTGLGLTIVKNLVELMDGTIHVESMQNAGSKFTVSLPVVCLPNQKKQQLNTQKNNPYILVSRRVLLCEDHPLNCEIAMRLLTRQGMMVETAGNGEEGLLMFSKSPEFYYDVILMDIQMPKMDGLIAAKNIRSLNRKDAKRIPIVAMTANAFEDDVQKSVSAGMNEHLTKPIEPKKLFSVLEGLLS